MTSKRTSTAISNDVQEDLDVLEFELKNSLRKSFPANKRRTSGFDVSYDANSGRRLTSSRKKSCKKANRK